jgi:hypothetical protein
MTMKAGFGLILEYQTDQSSTYTSPADSFAENFTTERVNERKKKRQKTTSRA